MKYKAIIETDEFEDFEFYEDGNGKYIQGIDAGAVNSEWIALYFTECKQESVLDKIKTEIEKQEKWLFQARLTAYNVDIALNAIKAVIAESEVEEKYGQAKICK